MPLLRMRGRWSLIQARLYESVVAAGIEKMYDLFVEAVTPRVEEGSRVLDVGCGRGQVTGRLALEMPDCHVIGVDLSDDMVREAREHISGRENLEFRRGDALDLPFDDESFDVVISVASIKHWPDRFAGVQEILRILTPGGSACILEADRDCSKSSTARFVADWRHVVPGSEPLLNWYFRHIVAGQALNLDELVGLMTRAGLVEIEYQHQVLSELPLIAAWGRKRVE